MAFRKVAPAVAAIAASTVALNNQTRSDATYNPHTHYIGTIASNLAPNPDLHGKIYPDGFKGWLAQRYVETMGADDNAIIANLPDDKAAFAREFKAKLDALDRVSPGSGNIAARNFAKGALTAYDINEQVKKALSESPEAISAKRDYDIGGKKSKRRRKRKSRKTKRKIRH
jgi:hypothetical protein